MHKRCTVPTNLLEEVVVHRLALIVFQVGKRRRLNSDIEAPTLVCSERNPDERHLPTVQISRYGDGCRGQFSILYIKSRGEGNTRLWRQIHTTIETYRLRHIALISRSSVIHIRYAVTYDIVKSNIPRYREVVV